MRNFAARRAPLVAGPFFATFASQTIDRVFAHLAAVRRWLGGSLPGAPRPRRVLRQWICVLWIVAGGPLAAFAVGPHNVAVVVNRDSWASLTVANRFVALRQIPATNVISLTGIPDPEQITVDEFRERILKPVLQVIAERGLEAQIDCVAYSIDLPHAVSVRSDLAERQVPRVLTPVGSLNGLTFLYHRVLNAPPAYLDLNANRYVRRPLQPGSEPLVGAALERYREVQQALGKQDWATAEGGLRKLLETQARHPGLHYNLACCLCRQEKFDDALKALAQAVACGWGQRRHSGRDEDLAPLRDRQEFQQLLTQMDSQVLDVQPTRGFRRSDRWGPLGERLSPADSARGESYLLAVMLGASGGRGNSVEEMLDCLQRSAAADSTRPPGTVYFPVNSNVRSTTRDPLYRSAARQLESLQVGGKVIEGVLPREKADVIGAMVGTANFDWEASGSRILPGAICEHLTSFGGVLRERSGQTPLSEWIRHGAAGSSGTVTEPYALQAKFPLPFLHVHYCRGATLAEAFYQSVAGPYQLLIVGDPLCRPWATPPRLADLTLVSDGRMVFPEPGPRPESAHDKNMPGDNSMPLSVKGKIQVRAASRTDAPEIAGWQLLLDGKRVGEYPPKTTTFELDTAPLPDGYHRLTLVALAADLSGTPASQSVALRFANHQRTLTLAIAEPAESDGSATAVDDWNTPLRVRVAGDDVGWIKLLHHDQVLATADRAEATFDINLADVGWGRVALTAVAGTGDRVSVVSAPLVLNVAPPKPLPEPQAPTPQTPEPATPEEPAAGGLQITWADGTTTARSSTDGAAWGKLNRPAGTEFTAAGSVRVAHPGITQLQIYASFAATCRINGEPLPAIAPGRWNYLPLSLSVGTHRLTIEGQLSAKPRLMVRAGQRGTQALP